MVFRTPTRERTQVTPAVAEEPKKTTEEPRSGAWDRGGRRREREREREPPAMSK